jgi:mycothiol synthase
MHLRPYRPEDLPAVAELQATYEKTWFGRPEHDVDEMKEQLELADVIAVADADGRLVGVGTRWRTGSSLLVDPTTDAGELHARLIAWLAEVEAPNTEVLDRDEALRDALAAAGWRPDYSSFELIRPVSPGWTLPTPDWPAGVELRPYSVDDTEALHRLIYRDAGWADVPGHHARELEEWQKIFLAGRTGDELPVLAWRDDRLVGAVVLRLFSDGTGWIAQLAVARDERGQGLGRALLLEGLRRMVAADASTLGLSVMAANRGALQLYLGVGLTIDREWQTWTPPV